MSQSIHARFPNIQLRNCATTLAAVVALLSPVQVLAQNVAVVNGKAVPKARVEALLSQALRQGNQGEPLKRTPELEAQVRDEVVWREILEQAAVKQGLARTREFKEQVELARQSLLIRELFTNFQEKNPVTQADIQAEYDKFKAKQSGTEYRARHILVEKEDEAKALIAQIKAGAKFEELAKKNSKDPGSGENGGDLDWAGAGAYVPEFSQAMAKLKKGEMTEAPVKSQFGFHIIKLEDTRPAQFPTLEEVSSRIQQNLMQAKVAKYRDELRAQAKTDYKFNK
ncbi:MAG: peptidylprolyl isomerase [Burkholderiaceae bacterium]|nr:peptidylprolyl isomerase [Burkholderiaceae bacterium]